MTVHKIGSKAREKLIVTKKYPDSIPKPVVDTTELRLRSIEQSLNLILQKLDNGNDNGNNISSISK
jgi:ribosome assembly protein YihI (activator of Der GTPase)